MKIIFRILTFYDKNDSNNKNHLTNNNSSNSVKNNETILSYDTDKMDIVTDCDQIDNEINANNIIKHKNNVNNTNNNNDDYTKDIMNLDVLEKSNATIVADTSSNDNNGNYHHQINAENNKLDIVQECNLVESSRRNRMRIALGVLIRLILPLCNGVVRGLRGIRGVRLLRILQNLGASRHMLTNMLAYAVNTVSMSLSSVQVVHRIDPILKIMKLKKSSNSKSLTSTPDHHHHHHHHHHHQLPFITLSKSVSLDNRINNTNTANNNNDELEKCIVTLNVLAEPPPGTPIRADIVFIHGLHGSLVNTWKQGLWNSEGRKEDFKRPPKPPLRPPKRPRHSRSSIFIPPQLQKRAKYAESDFYSAYNDSYDSDSSTNKENPNITKHFSYDCGQPDSTEFCDGVEYSFPTFRLRREDHHYHHHRHRRYHNRSSSLSSASSSASELSISSENYQKSNEPLSSSNTDTNNKNDTETYSKCWPGDWLPLDCPGVRVMAINYTTDPYLWRPVWVRERKRTSLSERAREMTDMLIEKRVGYGHPIIWVGHSKGGIFIKQIIVDAWESGKPAAAPLWRSSRGVFFYSVPHRGSPLADFSLPFLRRSIELTEIQKNSSLILDLHRRFVALYQSGNLKIDVFSFVETALTLMSVLYLRIVGVDSADPGIGEVCGVHLDHREICKPRSRNCILYTELVKMINRVS